jgi:hypothetical protein
MSAPAQVRGMTLLAFLVAMALGAMLLLLAADLVVVSRHSLRWQAAATDLERAGARALGVIEDELRAAGFRAGVDVAAPPPNAPGCGVADGWALALFPALAFADRGADGGYQLSDGSLPDCLPLGSLQTRSDILALRRTALLPSAALPGLSARRVRASQWYLFTEDTGSGDFHYLGNNAGPGDLPSGSRQAWEWRNVIFYVRDYSVSPRDGVPTLCVEQLQGAGMRSQCLVEGIERLHLEFSLDRDGDGAGDDRVLTPTAAELRLALRATVYLHGRSLEALRASRDVQVLDLGGEEVVIPAGDPHLHRVFVRTVPLVNLG